jgi:tetratricopeptide (TPR) repeat protein
LSVVPHDDPDCNPIEPFMMLARARRFSWMILAPMAAAIVAVAVGCSGLARAPGPASAGQAAGQMTPAEIDARYLEARLAMAAGRPEAAVAALAPCAPLATCPDETIVTLVRAQWAAGQGKQAQATLEAALRRRPGSVELLLAQGSLLRRLGRLKDAIATLDKALAIAPGRQDLLEAQAANLLAGLISGQAGPDEIQKMERVYGQLLQARQGTDRLAPLLTLALLHERAGQPDKAVQATAEAVQISPRDPRVLEAHAMALASAKRLGEAIDVYGALLLANPNDEQALRKAQALLLAQGGEPAAGRYFARWAADHPDNVGAQRAAARVLAQAKRWDDAEACLNRALRVAPGDPAILLALIQENLDAGRTREAIAKARQLCRQGGPLAPAVALSVAQALDAKGLRAEAKGWLASYQKDFPFDVDVAMGLATLYSRDKQWNQAIAALEAARVARPSDFEVIARLAQALAAAGRPARAQAILDALPPAVEREHGAQAELLRAALDVDRGSSLFQDGRLGQAERVAAQAQARLDKLASLAGPQDRRQAVKLRVSALALQGEIMQKRGDFAGAEAAYAKARDLAPDDADAWNALAYFYAETGRKLDVALRAANKALELDPGEPHAIDTLGWIYYRQGRHAEAVEQLEKAVKALGDDPDVAEVLSHLGDACLAAGRPAAARRAWLKALQVKGHADLASIRKKLQQTPK